MTEKFLGLIPPGSIWYRLSRDETIALMRYKGELEGMTLEQIASIESSDIQGVRGKIDELENMLKDAGLTIVTLFD